MFCELYNYVHMSKQRKKTICNVVVCTTETNILV